MKRYRVPHIEEDTGVEQWRAQGKSMLPFVPPRSRLMLKELSGRSLGVGDVICYLDPNGRFVAHRIVGFRKEEGEEYLEVRGDSQSEIELVERVAVIGVVELVRVGPASYRTDGFFGRTARTVAIEAPSVLRVVGRAVGGVWEWFGAIKGKYKL